MILVLVLSGENDSSLESQYVVNLVVKLYKINNHGKYVQAGDAK